MGGDANTRTGYAPALVAHVLAACVAGLSPRRRQPRLVGLSGLQGSGKSTLARELERAARRRGIACVVLSLDDFYLGRRERQRLARAVHPLLATRGVPGTHDLGLLRATLAALTRADAATPARIPRFDKGRDTRRPPSRWPRIARQPQLIVLEGWCVGVPPQASAELHRPLNALEREADRDGRWRSHVNTALARDYAPLWRELERLVLLQAPDFAVVRRWRGEAEAALRARHAPRAMDEARLRRFLMHYERLSRHALATLPARADLCIGLDARRRARAGAREKPPCSAAPRPRGARATVPR